MTLISEQKRIELREEVIVQTIFEVQASGTDNLVTFKLEETKTVTRYLVRTVTEVNFDD